MTNHIDLSTIAELREDALRLFSDMIDVRVAA